MQINSAQSIISGGKHVLFLFPVFAVILLLLNKIFSESLGGLDFLFYLCPVHFGAHTFLFAQSLLESPPRKA